MAPVPPAFAGETQGAGQWTGGGRVLLHLQRDLQQNLPVRTISAAIAGLSLPQPSVVRHLKYQDGFR